MMEGKSMAMRWTAFIGAWLIIFALWFGVAPCLRDNSESLKAMADFVNETEIETGEFYYTDVEIVGRAALGTEATFRFTPRKMVD